MSNVFNVGIHYVRDYLFDLVVDLDLERYGGAVSTDKWPSEDLKLLYLIVLKEQHQLLINGCQGNQSLSLFKAINC